jgi:hypothetical protein
MTDERGSYREIEANPLIAELLARGAESAMMLQGYVGPSMDAEQLRLYPQLNNLLESIDIPRSDIVHVVESPRSGLGGVIVWVKKDAQLAVRRVERTDVQPRRPRLVDVNKGRLSMRVRAQPRGEVCISWCGCDICMTNCQPTPICRPVWE